MRGNQEAKILAKTFRDHLTVYRNQLTRDSETQEDILQPQIVYENIPCGFSQGGISAPDRQEFYSKKQMTAVLFTMPGIFLMDNDQAVVITEAGQTFRGKTGKTFGYISHGETPFEPEEMA